MIIIADTLWEPKVKENLSKIKKIKEQKKDLGINLVYPSSATTPDQNWGPWEKKYYETLEELRWWQSKENLDSWDGVTKEDVDCHVKESEKKEMKKLASSWLEETVNNTGEELGKFDDYDSTVNRTKGSNFHQRGHYFIFYKDGSKEHWLALYPSDGAVGGFDNALVDGHTHKAFILEFDKPVRKLVDVYTCIGCGAAEGDYFTSLHQNYNNNSSDSWDVIHKNLPFEPWFSELSNPIVIPPLTAWNKIMTHGGRCMGSNPDVWQGATIQDLEDKTFDKAYGHVPNSGTIQWKLSRSEQNEAKWAEGRISDYIDALWEKDEFTSFKDKTVYQQKAMDMIIQECLKEKDYTVDYFKDRSNINDWLAVLTDKFRELISAKKEGYKFLEKWIEQILDGVNIENIKKEIEQVVPKSDRPLVLREIWGQQIENFIRKEKAREFYEEHSEAKVTYDEVEIIINQFYQELFDSLGLNKKVSEIQQFSQVSQIETN